MCYLSSLNLSLSTFFLPPAPININTSMVSVVKACWNHTGSLLAFAGILSKEIFGVQFYNTFGQVRVCIRLYIRLYISAI